MRSQYEEEAQLKKQRTIGLIIAFLIIACCITTIGFLA